jgi:Icc protein
VTRAGLELSTVADDEVVLHAPAPGGGAPRVVRLGGLAPGTEHELEGVRVRTLERPGGERLCTLATVNDTHFGETACGVLEGFDAGPVLTREPGEPPYPATMNAAAASEIAEASPDVVVAKGDLTSHGTSEELGAFLDCYRARFGERLRLMRGNHDVAVGDVVGGGPAEEVWLPGVVLALLDTTIPGRPNGQVSVSQLEWLDELASRADRPVVVMGHHPPWNPSSRTRRPDYFGINPSDSERLVEVAARRPAISAYLAGHTHRNRTRRFEATGEMPWAEVACVKDYPGSWAEYRVFEGGILAVHRRISLPEALEWTERTRTMFGGLYPLYAFGGLEDRCFSFAGRGGR